MAAPVAARLPWSCHRQGDKLAIEQAQGGDPADNLEPCPRLGQHGQRGAPLIEGLDQGFEGLPHGDKAIGEALGPGLQAAIPGHRLKLGIEAGELALEPVQGARLAHQPLELGQVVPGIGNKPREQAHIGGRRPGRLGRDLVHQRLDGVTPELAGFRELLQLGGVFAGDLLQQLPHRHPALDQLQALLPLQLLLGPRLAKRQGDPLHLFEAAAELEGLIDHALHGAVHGVDAKRLEAHEHLCHLIELQRGVLGEALDPGRSLFATGNRPPSPP